MSKARTLADFISDGSEFADGTISVAEVSGAAPLASPTFTGTASGTFSGPLTGNVTGNVTGDLTGDVTGNVTGNLTGNVTGDVAGDIDLSAIAATIADTAVDIFVYDTRKDSDGGAWRKRTQHTSWYNETLNTSTRGSRKEFPAVAVIVVDNTSKRLTIYDGDDPDLPMWMIFTGDGSSTFDGTDKFLNATSYAYTCCSAKNGVVCMGSARSSEGDLYDYGLSVISFADDTAARWMNSKVKEWPHGIGKRESALTFSADDTSRSLVSGRVNDVAMTVLPNAPIDATTGLPVPTIAVATDGGLSIIKDDGSVIDYVPTTSGWHPNSVSVYDSDRFIMTLDGGAGGYIVPIGSSDVSFSIASASPSGWLHFRYVGNQADVYTLTQTQTSVAKSAVAGSKGTSFIDVDESNYSSSLVAYITSDYNTGWMNGDIKLATLSDTDDTNVTGSELVTNGTFDSDTSGWTSGNATLSLDSNRLKVANSGVTNGTVYQQLTGLTVGETYVVSVETTSGTAVSARILLGPIAGSGSYFAGDWKNGVHTATFTATQTAPYLALQTLQNSDGAYLFHDNVSVRLAEEDRSVNGNGLQVFGTVTKSAVSSGADLVAYSGFSTGNYLSQPYNSDLDFGTGDFCYQFWENHSQDLSNNTWLISWDRNGPSAWVLIGTVSIAGQMRFEVASGNYVDVTSPFDAWNCWHFVRRSGVCYVYLNGKQQTSFTSTDNLNASARGAGLSVGKIDYTGSNDYWRGSVALVRISATAPSPEQIKKIYEDEKHLFQDNAQATLYGSSDAVTALAHDDSTDLLHVGTSAGRSVFQGLRRVDNTTTAVGAAISSSNGLVADE